MKYWESIYALSAGAYTGNLYVMVNRMKGGGRAPPTLTSQGWVFHNDGMHARNRPLPLCVYSVGVAAMLVNIAYAKYY
jgi:hypothetical protein